MKKCLIILIIGLCFSAYSLAQENTSHNDHQHNNEIGFGIGAILLHKESVAPGIHLHYLRGVGELKKFGLGAGFESVFDEHSHYTLSIMLQYNIIRGLSIAYGPGLLILKEHNQNEFLFSNHIEATYGFNVGHVHIGPIGAIGFTKDDIHYMLGIHLGLGF